MTSQLNDEIYYEFPLPPPFTTEEGSLLDPELINTPGKIVIDESGQLLLKYITYRGIAGDILAIYNNFVAKEIPRILALETLDLDDGSKIIFTRPKIFLPRESKIDIRSDILLPYQARQRKDTYSFCLTADIEQVDANGQTIIIGGQPQIRQQKLIGCIPAMLRSIVDNLIAMNMSKEQLLQNGECAQDPGGYFIIKGEERIIITQERLRSNRILVYNDRAGDKMALLTSSSIRGSTVVRLYQDNDKSIRIHFAFLDTNVVRQPSELTKDIAVLQGRSLSKPPRKKKGYKTVCVLQIFRILGELVPDLEFEDLNNIVEYILQFVRSDLKNQALQELQGSYIVTLEVGNGGYKDIYQKSILRRKWQQAQTQARRSKSKELAMVDPEAPAEWPSTMIQIRNSVVEMVFAHINLDLDLPEANLSRIAKQKIVYLATMTARLLETLAERRGRPLDNRDHWANKRLDSAGNLLEQLFRQVWQDEITALKRRLAGQTVTVDQVFKQFQSRNITGDLEAAFIPNNWGASSRVRFRTKQENITDRLDRGQSIVALYSHITQINTPTNRRVKQPSIRAVQISQAGYVDIIDTPSGGAVGLVKRKALTCWISVERDYQEVWAVIMDNILIDIDINHTDVFVINGIPSGWCNGPEVRNILLRARRSLTISFDISIVYVEPELHVSTDSSRPTRPLLVIDTDLVPVIAKKKLWRESVEVLLQEGAIEYLDPWEAQIHALVATSIHDLTFKREDLARNRNLLTQFLTQKAQAQANLNLYQRPNNLTEEEIETKINQIRQKKIEQALDGQDNPDAGANWLWAAAQYRNITENIERISINIRRIDIKQYTHVEMDPTALLGAASSLEPFSGTIPAPRTAFQCNMARQSIGINHSNPATRFPAKDLLLSYPSRAVASTQMQRILGMDDLPAGQNVVVAIMTSQDNEEDGITIKLEALQNGLFTTMVFHSSEIIIEKKHIRRSSDISKVELPDETTITKTVITTETETTDYLIKPRSGKPFPRHTEENYDSINDEGLAIPDLVVSPGDCLVGVIRRIITKVTREVRREEGARIEIISTTTSTNLTYQDRSVYVNPWEGGVIDKVLVSQTTDGNIVVRVRVRTVGQPIVGDKVATRHAQKSIISRIVPAVDLPFTKDGLIPDLILNPHSIGKRMTIGTLIEITTSKFAALADERINGTAFRPFDLELYKESLQTVYGYKISGTEVMRSPLTGEIYPSEIMIGPSYYQLLKHRVKKKIQARDEGPVSFLTRQPVKGRKRGGGIRLGENEVSGLIAHGAAHFLRERMGTASDVISTAFCINCNRVTVGRVIEEKSICTHCEANEIRGCKIPYVFLTAVNFASMLGVKTGLITAEEARFGQITATGVPRLDLSTIPGSQEIEEEEIFEEEEEEEEEEPGEEFEETLAFGLFD